MVADRYPRPWRLRPLDHKYYGTEIIAANGRVVDGIKIWLTGDTPEDDELSDREKQNYEYGDDLSHTENVASFELAALIIHAVNALDQEAD